MDVKSIKGMSARQFMATLSTAGREERKPLPEPTAYPATIRQEIWVDGEWVTRQLVWDGNSYVVAPNA